MFKKSGLLLLSLLMPGACTSAEAQDESETAMNKLLLSMVLLLALLLTAIGCSNEQVSDEEMFVGTWANEEILSYGVYVYTIEEGVFKALWYRTSCR